MQQTQEDMVNALLRVIGESAVNEVDETHPDIQHALLLWDEYSTEIQSYGWWFNKETWQLEPQTDGTVVLSSNIITVDTQDTNYVKKGRYLYDLENHTYDFTDASSDDLELDFITYWDIDELPPVAYNYILSVCKQKMLVDLAFDANKAKELAGDAQRRFFMMQKHHLRFAGPNAKSSTTASEFFNNMPSR